VTAAWTFSPEADSTLTNPGSLAEITTRDVPGGRTEVSGYATFQGIRVHVYRVDPWGDINVWGELPVRGVTARHAEPQVEGATGRVEFRDLDRFWLTRTTTYDVIDATTPRPGLMTHIDGQVVGLVDTTGTVTFDGVPQVQLVWLDAAEPVTAGWSVDGYGSFTKLVDRSLVAAVRRVEWTAIWRDVTVQVAAIGDGSAHIFVGGGALPPFTMPEMVLTKTRDGGWSAVVPLGQLSLRQWTLTETPLGVGVVAKCVGLLRGRIALVARPAGPHVPGETDVPAPGSAITVKKSHGETVTDEFALDARSRHFWDWRVRVEEHEVTDLREVTATTTWQGGTYPVEGVNEKQAQVYLNRSSVDVTETTPFVYSARPVERSALPVDSTFW
jgi:hypothetical protein